ncbi:KamA family radical SAM protein [Streptomyces sp. TLI_146]|uniref:KamA family radical SAM protein n=1 Tax=Streptomyces sp. TLI_146 TaxID=1938858 RepID=UPI000CACD7D2|nr:lysine 2,3-aminomutase [Streptomyces sp. TLI_146]PKV90157.1 KamA family protein [Streptomyces sp. TLI_146]
MDRAVLRSIPGDHLADAEQVRTRVDEDTRHAMRVVSAVLPFKVNSYIMDELIDWSRPPYDDPVFRLVFPHRDMLPPDMFRTMSKLIAKGASRSEVRREANRQRLLLKPHPGGQLEQNVPRLDGRVVEGLQHKYRETVLLFPGAGQTCHAYCGYCFRWAQFVGMPELKQSLAGPANALEYLREHTEVTDVLITGGDPLIMSTARLREYIEPLLAPEFHHIRSLRIGTKALGYWPYRFLTDPDADDLLRLFEQCVRAGRTLALMTHFSHGAELATAVVERALVRIRATGAVLRAQAPMVRYVNDDSAVWARMWQRMVELGIHPYYAFVERDTGARNYFAIPLTRALAVYQGALRQVSGLARTSRGPLMSATPGKVVIHGESHIAGRKVFVCSFLQARLPEAVGQPFFAAWSPTATWFDELEPAFSDSPFPTAGAATGPHGAASWGRTDGS